MKRHYEVVSVQDDNSITAYGNADIETATNQVADDPNEVSRPTTGNIYADHRYDIKKIAEKRNCDMNVATSIWEYEYFKGNITPEIAAQRERWMEFMRLIICDTKFTLADIF